MAEKDKTKDNGNIPPENNGNSNNEVPKKPEKRDEYHGLLTDFYQAIERAKEGYQESAKGRDIKLVDIVLGSRAGIICKTDERGVPQLHITDEEVDNQGKRKTQRFFIGLQSSSTTMDKASVSSNLAPRTTTVKEFEVSSQAYQLVQNSIKKAQEKGEQTQRKIDEEHYEYFPVYDEKGKEISINEDREGQINLELIVGLVTHARQIVCQQLGAKVKTADVALMRWTEHLEYANTEGAKVDSIIPRVAFTVMVKTNGGSEAFGCIRGAMGTIIEVLRRYDSPDSQREPMEIVEELAKSVAKEAMDLDRAQNAAILGSECPVIMSSGVSGVLAHEVFGHPSEADIVCANRRNKTAQVTLKSRLGAQVSNHTGFTIIDTGKSSVKLGKKEVRYGFGSMVVDEEGCEAKETALVQNGIQVNVLSDRYTFNEIIDGLKKDIADAMRKHGLSGNVRREKYDMPTLVRMTNTFIMPDPKGPKSLAEMAKLVPKNKTGIYVESCSGGWVDPDSGTWMIKGKLCYLIENGIITDKPVRDVNITGNITKFLDCIKAIGNEDTVEKTFSGYCGKDNQWVPVDGCGPIIYMDHAKLGGGSYRPWSELVQDYHVQHTQLVKGQRTGDSVYLNEFARADDSGQSHANICLVTAVMPIEDEVNFVLGKNDHADFEAEGDKIVDRKEVYDE